MILHCNNTACQHAFEALPGVTASSRFCGGAAVRTREFQACQFCGRVDSHWIFAVDVAPTFEGTPYQQKEALRKWRLAN
jgi:hypothetical protein